MTLVTSEQLRAGRAMTRMRQEELSAAAEVGIATIRRLEAGDGPLAAHLATVRQLQRALEAAGVIFTDGDEPGVRLKNRETTAA